MLPGLSLYLAPTRAQARELHEATHAGQDPSRKLQYVGPVSYTHLEGYIKNTTFLGEPDWNTYDRDIWTAGWQLEHQFNDAWKVSQNARYTHVDSLYCATVGNGVRGAALTNLNTLLSLIHI